MSRAWRSLSYVLRVVALGAILGVALFGVYILMAMIGF